MREPSREEMIEGIAKGFVDFLESKGSYKDMGTKDLQKIFKESVQEAAREHLASIKVLK